MTRALRVLSLIAAGALGVILGTALAALVLVILALWVVLWAVLWPPWLGAWWLARKALRRPAGLDVLDDGERLEKVLKAPGAPREGKFRDRRGGERR